MVQLTLERWFCFAAWAGEPKRDSMDIYHLKLKNNMKELDAKAFNEKEKQAFQTK